MNCASDFRDQEAIQPLVLATYKPNPFRYLDTYYDYRLSWEQGQQPYPAACAIPKGGIPQGAHLLRAVPCGGEWYNQGVLCAIVKVTAGKEPLVEAWADIGAASGPMTNALWEQIASRKRMCAKNPKSNGCARLAALGTLKQNADNERPHFCLQSKI